MSDGRERRTLSPEGGGGRVEDEDSVVCSFFALFENESLCFESMEFFSWNLGDDWGKIRRLDKHLDFRSF